jgi:hypothetical protein
MVIEFDKNKDCIAYKDLVENPEDRTAIKNFAKKFDKNLIGASVKLYQKLKSSPNATIYNQTTSTNNKIELKSGVKDKDFLVLKLRIQNSYRKFFYFYETSLEEEEFCLKKNWVGQFDNILKVYVYEVNNHDYSKA